MIIKNSYILLLCLSVSVSLATMKNFFLSDNWTKYLPFGNVAQSGTDYMEIGSESDNSDGENEANITFLPLDVEIIDYLNNFVTLNENPIVFEPEEIDVLKTISIKENYEKKKKMKVLRKYKRKIQDLQCTNGIIAKMIVIRMNEMVKIDDIVLDNQFLMKSHTYLSRMLSVLYTTKRVAQKWLWDLFCRVHSIIHMPENNQFLIEHILSDKQLPSDIQKFISLCVVDNYLTSRKFLSSELFAILSSIGSSTYENARLSSEQSANQAYRYKYEEYFTTRNIYLQNLWNEEEILFKPISGVQIKWDSTKRLLDAARMLTANHVTNLAWIMRPFDVLNYHQFVLYIFALRLYCHVSVHLIAYKSLVLKNAHSLEKENIEFCNELLTAAMFANVADECFNVVHDYVKNIESLDDNQLTYITDYVGQLVNGILKEFDEHNKEERFAIENGNNIIDPNVLHLNTKLLRDSFAEIKTKLNPIDYKFIGYFLEAKYGIEKYYYPSGN